MSPHGIWKIKQIISSWLSRDIPAMRVDFARLKYLIFDGTYFNHENCFLLLLDGQTGKAVEARYHIRENYATAYEIFSALKDRGVCPVAVTIDGNTSVIRALRAIWPKITIQRCIFHIQRQGLAWLRRNPKLESAKSLREIFLSVTSIDTTSQRDDFYRDLVLWEKQHGQSVVALPKDHKVYSDIQRARSLLHNAWPDMFHFLNDRKIAPTTNRIEGYFSMIKGRYKQHHGLSRNNRSKYLFWYIYLKSKG